MKTVALLSAAVMASTTLAQTLGSAIVTNQCAYPVYVFAVPAADGGYTENDGVLKTGDSFTQTWTQLTNNAGWSLKLSKADNVDSIMQYEYTYQGTDVLWFDLSDVNGNPWNGDWEITANGNCVPKHTAYRYSTDDAYGMQACNPNSTITVTLCSGNDAATTTSVSISTPTSTSAASSSASAIATTSTTVAATFTSSSTTLTTSVVVTSVISASTTAQASTTAASATTSVDSHTWWHHHYTPPAAVKRHLHGHPHARV